MKPRQEQQNLPCHTLPDPLQVLPLQAKGSSLEALTLLGSCSLPLPTNFPVLDLVTPNSALLKTRNNSMTSRTIQCVLVQEIGAMPVIPCVFSHYFRISDPVANVSSRHCIIVGSHSLLLSHPRCCWKGTHPPLLEILRVDLLVKPIQARFTLLHSSLQPCFF